MAALAACGGGGGATVGVTDPAPAYKGNRSKAVVSQDNATALALGGYTGGRLGTAIGTGGMSKTTTTTTLGSPVIFQLTSGLKKSLLQINIPNVSQRQKQQPATSAKVLRRTEKFDATGPYGGRASYSLDINDSTGSYAGTIDYANFTTAYYMFTGKVDILGTMNPDLQAIDRLTISFGSLQISSPTGYVVVLTGSISWGFNLAASSDTMTMNVVMLDQSSGKAYWLNDYTVTSTYGSYSVTETISGRYYDPDYGYVDFASETPLVTNYSQEWPASGTISFSGGNGTSVRLDFEPERIVLGVDTNGDRIVDLQTDFPTKPDTPDIKVNTPPIAEAGTDQTVQQGTTVYMDTSGSSDPDGDALSYMWSFESCPEYPCPGISNGTTATASFVPGVPGKYVLRLTVFDGESSASDTMTVTVTPAEPTEPHFQELQWEYGVYGTSIGDAGLLTSDLDEDGTPEIIATASASSSNNFWYVVRQAAGGGFEQVWRSEQYAVPIVRLLVSDLTRDGRNEVIVGLADGTVHIYNGRDQRKKTLKPITSLSALAIGDLEGDGTCEIVIGNAVGIHVYDPNSGQLLWSVANTGGSSIETGNVDGDEALEIVTTTYGGKGYVIDGKTGAVEWEYINGFGAQLALGDVDGDGMQEIVGASGWYRITIFDADRRTPAWEISTSLDIAALVVADSDEDGNLEIIYGDGQWGKLHAIDPATRLQKWSVANQDHGISGIAVGDVNKDGTNEVVWGAGGSSSGADHLYVAIPSTGTVEWHSMHIDGPLSAVAVGDVDDDGADEIVMVSRESDSGYEEGVIHIFDARTHALEYREKLGIMDWIGARSVAIGDIDGDGKTEFAVTTADIYDGIIRVYDGATHTLKYQSDKYPNQSFAALTIADADGNGTSEIIAGLKECLVVFDVSLKEKWRSTSLLDSYYGYIDAIHVSDVDGNGNPDIVASVSGKRLVVVDGVNHDLKLMLAHDARGIDVADTDGDGSLEIVSGRLDGKIDVFDGKTFVLKRTISMFATGSIKAIRLEDLDGDLLPEWILARDAVLEILDGRTQKLKWRSDLLGTSLGEYNHIAIGDPDGDGRKDVVVGAAPSLYHFESRPFPK
ncbi:MAG: hypothetical protein A2X58_01240 [Nitrospirae bacterium GWC2_56_14]|nr:MAG: hypothetical protein A2X58_01240 [Nitrospirae bacterium GWC2_56_14]